MEAAERLRDGALTSFDITGSTHSGILSHVVPALASSRCFLSSLKLNFVSGLKSLAEQVLTESVLKQLAPTLQVLEAHNCGSHGLVPPGLRQCRQLRHLHLGLNRFDGGLPQWIGELDRLRHLDIEQVWRMDSRHSPMLNTNSTPRCSVTLLGLFHRRLQTCN